MVSNTTTTTVQPQDLAFIGGAVFAGMLASALFGMSMAMQFGVNPAGVGGLSMIGFLSCVMVVAAFFGGDA